MTVIIECCRNKLFCLKVGLKVGIVFSKMVYIVTKFDWCEFLQGGLCYEEV